MPITSKELWKSTKKQDYGLIGELHRDLEKEEQFSLSRGKLGQVSYGQAKTKKGKQIFRKLSGLYSVMNQIKSSDAFVTSEMLTNEMREEYTEKYGISSKELDRLVGDIQQGRTPDFTLKEMEKEEDGSFSILQENARKQEDAFLRKTAQEYRDKDSTLKDWSDEKLVSSIKRDIGLIHNDWNLEDPEHIHGNRVVVKVKSKQIRSEVDISQRSTAFLDKIQKDKKKKLGMERLKQDLAAKRQGLAPHQSVALNAAEIAEYKKQYGLSKKDLEKLSQNVQADLTNNALVAKKAQEKEQEERLVEVRILQQNHQARVDALTAKHKQEIDKLYSDRSKKIEEIQYGYEEELTPLRRRKIVLDGKVPSDVYDLYTNEADMYRREMDNAMKLSMRARNDPSINTDEATKAYETNREKLEALNKKYEETVEEMRKEAAAGGDPTEAIEKLEQEQQDTLAKADSEFYTMIKKLKEDQKKELQKLRTEYARENEQALIRAGMKVDSIDGEVNMITDQAKANLTTAMETDPTSTYTKTMKKVYTGLQGKTLQKAYSETDPTKLTAKTFAAQVLAADQQYIQEEAERTEAEHESRARTFQHPKFFHFSLLPHPEQVEEHFNSLNAVTTLHSDIEKMSTTIQILYPIATELGYDPNQALDESMDFTLNSLEALRYRVAKAAGGGKPVRFEDLTTLERQMKALQTFLSSTEDITDRAEDVCENINGLHIKNFLGTDGDVTLPENEETLLSHFHSELALVEEAYDAMTEEVAAIHSGMQEANLTFEERIRFYPEMMRLRNKARAVNIRSEVFRNSIGFSLLSEENQQAFHKYANYMDKVDQFVRNNEQILNTLARGETLSSSLDAFQHMTLNEFLGT